MAKKDLGFDIVYRGETRDRIESGKYVFFQCLKEHGGSYWLGLVYDVVMLRDRGTSVAEVWHGDVADNRGAAERYRAVQ